MSVIWRGGAEHQAAEDRSLLRDQERGERQAEDDPGELGPVSRQHLDRDPGFITRFAPVLEPICGSRAEDSPADVQRRDDPSAASENVVM